MIPEISLYTALRNRFDQFSATFPSNLEFLVGNPNVEWVILDYGSDEAEESIYDNSTTPPNIRWFRKEADYWHGSRARNEAAIRTSGQILMSLDGDNFITNALSACDIVEEGVFLHNWDGQWGTGTCGRLAFHRNDLSRLGGYDDEFLPAGFEDLDLMNRALSLGLKCVRIHPGERAAILNSRKETVKNATAISSPTWDQLNQANKIRSKWNISMGLLKANYSKYSFQRGD